MIARIPRILILLAVAAAALSVAVAAMPVVSNLSARDVAWAAANIPAPPPETRVQADRTDLSPIFDFAPFGRADPPPAPVVADAPAAAPPDFTLQGVSVSDPDSRSSAIIGDGQGKTASYAIGDALAPGVVLTGIAPDNVTLDLSGESQTLYFPAPTVTVPVAAASIADRPRIVMPDLENLIPRDTAAAAASLAPSAPPKADPPQSDKLAATRDAFQRNPRAVLLQFGITASDKGYLIGDTTPQNLLKIGLAPGDLVTAINGQSVGDITADQAFLLEASTGPRVQIDLLRNGQPVNLSVPLQ